MEHSKSLSCEKCKQVVQLDKIRLMPQGETNLRVCEQCMDQMKEQPKSLREEKPVPIHKMFCTKCRYAFRFKPVAALKCPYCGSGANVVKHETTANSVLDEVSSPDFDETSLPPSKTFNKL